MFLYAHCEDSSLKTRDELCVGSVYPEEEEKEVRAWIGPPALGGSGFQGLFLSHSRTVGVLGK